MTWAELKERLRAEFDSSNLPEKPPKPARKPIAFTSWVALYVAFLATAFALYEFTGERADVDASYRDFYNSNLTGAPHGLRAAGLCFNATGSPTDCPNASGKNTPVDRDPINWWHLHLASWVTWFPGTLASAAGVALGSLWLLRRLDGATVRWVPPATPGAQVLRFLMPLWLMLVGLIWALLLRGPWA